MFSADSLSAPQMGAAPGFPQPPQAVMPQKSKLKEDALFAISEKEEARPKLKRKGSFDSICDMELNRSLDSMSGSD